MASVLFLWQIFSMPARILVPELPILPFSSYLLLSSLELSDEKVYEP